MSVSRLILTTILFLHVFVLALATSRDFAMVLRLKSCCATVFSALSARSDALLACLCFSSKTACRTRRLKPTAVDVGRTPMSRIKIQSQFNAHLQHRANMIHMHERTAQHARLRHDTTRQPWASAK